MGDNMQYSGLAGSDLSRYLNQRRSANDAMVGYTNFLSENQISPEFYNSLSDAERMGITQSYGNLNNLNGGAIKFGDIRSVGDLGSWLGQGNNAQTGLAALGAAADMYGVYKQSKYQDKMADLSKRQQDIYEQEVKRQQQRQDKAQAAYDKAQGV